MHMADALVTPGVAGAMYLCSGAVMGYSIKRVRALEQPEKVPLMGVMGAFVFAAQMVNVAIPGTGSSGHLCGGMLLAALLGPEASFVTMGCILLIQALLFADGGLLALGANLWNMAFYGCFLGGLLFWKPMMSRGISKRRILLASLLGCVVSLQLGAFSVVLQTFASGMRQLPFGIFLAAMQPIHLLIGLAEGLITAAVLLFVQEMRPALFWGVKGEALSGMGKLSGKQSLGVLAAAALVLGGLVSLAASGAPDGLEWAIQKTAGASELSYQGLVHTAASRWQEATAVLPDYGIPGKEAAAGTALSGVLGGAVVMLVCVGCCYGLKLWKGKHRHE